MSSNFILVPILIPIIYGIIMMLHPIKNIKLRNQLLEIIVIINSLLTFLLLIKQPEGTLYLFSLGEKLPLTLRIDGLATFFGALVSFMWPLATLYTFEYMRHEQRVNTFLAFYTITFGVTLGIAFSGNLITMYLFYETLTMVTLPLVMHTMTAKAKRATRMYLYYMIGGTAFAFIGIVVYVLFSTNIEFVYGGALDLVKIAGHKDVMLFVYILAFFGFGVKAAIFPFHSWLPAVSVAPTPVTALLHAVAVVKSGVFAIMRLTVYCFGFDYLFGTWAQNIVMLFSMITIAYASTLGVRESHLKRRLAYSTVSNLSYIVLGVSTMTPFGYLAGLLHMMVHAIMKISGFFCIGSVMHQTDKNYISEIDGLGYKMPRTFTALLISGLSLAGVPLFAGFIGKWKIADSLFINGSSLATAGVFVLLYSALMTAIYMLTIIIRGFFPDNSYDKESLSAFSDPSWLMILPLAVFSFLTIAIGVHAQPLIDILNNVAFGLK